MLSDKRFRVVDVYEAMSVTADCHLCPLGISVLVADTGSVRFNGGGWVAYCSWREPESKEHLSWGQHHIEPGPPSDVTDLKKSTLSAKFSPLRFNR